MRSRAGLATRRGPYCLPVPLPAGSSSFSVCNAALRSALTCGGWRWEAHSWSHHPGPALTWCARRWRPRRCGSGSVSAEWSGLLLPCTVKEPESCSGHMSIEEEQIPAWLCPRPSPLPQLGPLVSEQTEVWRWRGEAGVETEPRAPHPASRSLSGPEPPPGVAGLRAPPLPST